MKIGDLIVSRVDAQGMRRGCLYRVMSDDSRHTFAGKFTVHGVRAESSSDVTFYVVNTHLLTERLVDRIRRVCADELGGSPERDFFHLDYYEDESPDEALVRLFMDEWRISPDVDRAIRVLCHS